MSYATIAKYYNTIFPFRQPVLDLLAKTFKDTTNLLDLGCGAGLYPAGLQKLGIKCTGVDLDSEMISQAKNNHPKIDYRVMSLLDLDQLGDDKYQGAYCIGNVLSYLKAEQLEIFLSKLHALLPKGATWLFQVMNWDYVLTCKAYQFPDVEIDKSLTFRRCYTDISCNEIKFHRQLLENQTTIYHEIDTLYPLTSQQYIELHQKAEFSLTSQFSNFSGTKFSPNLDTANLMSFQKI